MSLVFGSVFLFVLLSPGLFFRFAYLQGTYSKLNFRVSAVEEIFWALIPALFLQLSGYLFIEKILHQNIRIDILYALVSGTADLDLQTVERSFFTFLIYTLVMLLLSAGAGIFTRELVQKLRLDIYMKFLRFRNEWHYLLNGKILKNQSNNIILIQVDVLVNSTEGNLIYSGQLEDYFLTKENSLDRIYLTNVYRRKLKDDLQTDVPNPGFMARDTDERYYRMPGYLIVIPYDRIINLNITYYIDELEQPADGDEFAAE